MRAVLDDAVLHRPALAPRVLEVEIAEVDSGADQRAQRTVECGDVEAGGHEETEFGGL